MTNKSDIVVGFTEDASTSRLERFISMAPGEYWKAKIEYPQCSAGDDLLITAIDEVDGSPHTVVLLPHPEILATSRYTEKTSPLRLRIEDFLENFEYSPDGEKHRQAKIQAMQEELRQLQLETNETMSNPDRISNYIGIELQKWEEELQEQDVDQSAIAAEGTTNLPATTKGSIELLMDNGRVRTDVGFAIGKGVTDRDVQVMQRAAEREIKKAEITTDWFNKQNATASGIMTKMGVYFKEKSEVALAKTSRMRQEISSLLDGIQSLDLYTGKGVTVETICKGASAPSDEKLTIMQAKLYMDEELSVYVDVAEDFDYLKDDAFVEQLASSKELVNQLLPTPRCVVSMAVRRKDIDYGDSFANLRKNTYNKSVFLLVRDGDNVYRVYSGIESHYHTHRLFPTKDEADRPFTGIYGEKITFNDINYTKGLEEHERLALHYKRFLILLCGLDHREQLFGDFYDRRMMFTFITKEFQSTNMRFVADDESAQLLAEDKPGVREFFVSQNKKIKSGARVLAYYGSMELTEYTAPAMWTKALYHKNDRICYPVHHYGIHRIATNDQKLIIEVPVSRSRWRPSCDEYARGNFNAKVTVEKNQGWFQEVPGVLCIDGITLDQVNHYIYNRHARIHHLEYLRIFKRLAKLLHEEAEVQAESRAYLIDAIKASNIDPETDVEKAVDEAIVSWRASHQWATIPTVKDAAKLKPILNSLYEVLNNPSDTVDLVVDFASKSDLKPLRLASKSNSLILYVKTPLKDQDPTLKNLFGEWKWVTRIILKRGKTKLIKVSEKLAWLQETHVTSEQVIHEFDSDPEAPWKNKDREPVPATTLVRASATIKRRFANFRSTYNGYKGGIPQQSAKDGMDCWEQLQQGRSRVQDMGFGVPVGLALYRSGEKVTLRYLMVAGNSFWWFSYFGDQEQVAEFLAIKQQYYARKHVPAHAFKETPNLWLIHSATLSDESFVLPDFEEYFLVPVEDSFDKGLNYGFNNPRSSVQGISLIPEACLPDGTPDLDVLFEHDKWEIDTAKSTSPKGHA